MLPAPALIIFHKQKTSGRLRFLCLPTGVLCFGGVPEGSSLKASGEGDLGIHPTHWLQAAEGQLHLTAGSLEPEAEFLQWLDTPFGNIPVLLAGLTCIDPPFEAAEALEGKFITIMDSRRLTALEQKLLGLAYEHVLG